MLEIINNTLGTILMTIFLLFVPGLLASLLIFKNLDKVERFVMSIIFSFMINAIMVFILGGNEYLKNLTGGLSKFNVLLLIMGLCAVLFLVLIIKHKPTKKEKEKSSSNYFTYISAQVVFVLLTILYFINKETYELSPIIFWTLMFLNIICVFTIIYRFRGKVGVISLVLLEVFITSIYVFGLAQNQMDMDSYFEAQYSSALAQNGYWDPTLGEGISENYYGYNPLLHFNVALMSIVSGISSYLIVKYFIIFVIRIVIVLLFFLIARELFEDKKLVPYLATLIFIGCHGVISIAVSRRFMAAIMIMFAIFCLLKNYKIKEKKWIVFFLIASFFIAVGDHSNTYLFIVFLLGLWLFMKILSIRPFKLIGKKDNIISLPLIIIVLLMSFFWLFYLSGDIFVEQDTYYIRDVSTYVKEHGPETVSKTFGFMYDSLGLNKDTGEEISSEDLDYQTKEKIDEIKTSDLSEKSKNDLINKLKNKESVVAVNYHYETVIASISQAILLSLALIGIVLYSKEEIFNKKKSENNLKWVLIYIGLFGFVLFSICGFLIRTKLNVFTSTYFWFFSIGISLMVGYCLYKILDYDNAILNIGVVFLISILFMGSLIIDYSPSIVNRMGDSGLWMESPKVISDSLYYSGEWAQNNLDKETNIIGDNPTLKVYSGYFELFVASNWWTKRIYHSDLDTVRMMLDARNLKLNEHNQKERIGKIDVLVVNTLNLNYPSILTGGLLTNKQVEVFDNELNRIYDNNEIIMYGNSI